MCLKKSTFIVILNNSAFSPEQLYWNYKEKAESLYLTYLICY